MNKKILGALLGIVLMGAGGLTANAATTQRTFAVSASIPTASGSEILLSSVNPATDPDTFTSLGSTANMDFGTLQFNQQFQIYLPTHYYAVDVAAVGGAGVPSVTVSYNDGVTPAGNALTLGDHTQATFVKVTSTGETLMSSHGPRKVLKALNETISTTDITGGSLRIYVGIITGEPGQTATGGVPFSNADKPGSYTGSLVVSSTVP